MVTLGIAQVVEHGIVETYVFLSGTPVVTGSSPVSEIIA